MAAIGPRHEETEGHDTLLPRPLDVTDRDAASAAHERPVRGSVIVVGAGPGVGAAVARRFGREGHPVGLVARDHGRLEAMAADLRAAGVAAEAVTADARRPEEVAARSTRSSGRWAR